MRPVRSFPLCLLFALLACGTSACGTSPAAPEPPDDHEPPRLQPVALEALNGTWALALTVDPPCDPVAILGPIVVILDLRWLDADTTVATTLSHWSPDPWDPTRHLLTGELVATGDRTGRVTLILWRSVLVRAMQLTATVASDATGRVTWNTPRLVDPAPHTVPVYTMGQCAYAVTLLRHPDAGPAGLASTSAGGSSSGRPRPARPPI